MTERHTLISRLIGSLINTGMVNSNLVSRPVAILWPDPERQWEAIIPLVQEKLNRLLVFGSYNQEKKQGPAIWLKCMVSKMLPQADWGEREIPVVYLPGMSKADIRNAAHAGLELQPLSEYFYTGAVWLQENGKEWTINAFLQNRTYGMNMKISQDAFTKELLKKALPVYITDSDFFSVRDRIDSDYLMNAMFPEFIPSLLKWICKGDAFLKTLGAGKEEIFAKVCISNFGFEPDHKNIKSIIEKLASRKNAWEQVWSYYSHSPHKYPEVEQWLRLVTPDGISLWSSVDDISVWPQLNDEKENELRVALLKTASMPSHEAARYLDELQETHAPRLTWVWAELGHSPLAEATENLSLMAKLCTAVYPSSTVEELEEYYIKTGHLCDRYMRRAFASVKTEDDKQAVTAAIGGVYKPWLETLTGKYQKLAERGGISFGPGLPEADSDDFLLFADGLRFDVAAEFAEQLSAGRYTTSLLYTRSALPSLTPTAKPAVSPVAGEISRASSFREFHPQFSGGKEVHTASFRERLEQKGYILVTAASDIQPGSKHWQETGELDKKGHEEQAGMVRRIPDFYEKLEEILQAAFDRGIKKVTIVTDHGWLLLPGGLPKETLPSDFVETRWGRCALLKEGVQSALMHHPWHWNPGIYIAYAPGISFFKKNQEYAHGGISLQECIVPVMTIERVHQTTTSAKILSVSWVNLRCTVETSGTPDGYQIDIRTKYTDSMTSVILSKNRTVQHNRCSVLIDSDAENRTITVVLTAPDGLIIDKITGIAGNN